VRNYQRQEGAAHSVAGARHARHEGRGLRLLASSGDLRTLSARTCAAVDRKRPSLRRGIVLGVH